MSLPNGFLDELRSRVSISQVVGRAVTWDLRKSNQGKGDFWAPCPFHHEKSASFHVDDRKGYYYCFGCHAKGDALTFLRETQNLGFMEAVEVLAREAGMTMPERDPGQRQRDDRRETLADVMERALRFFRMQLGTTQAADARAYLQRRGLTREQLDRWEIGFAPDEWQALNDHLKQAGVSPDLIAEAGLSTTGRDANRPYDRFRGRIIFPIRNARRQCIGFGGRAMAADAQAKYLNSPDTPLFHKGQSLYNIGPARTATGRNHALIVAEGYMDVIALASAGFEGAVAPLGTAVTEDQLRLMWRMHDEPVIALDGDAAGLRAGLRVAKLALPLLVAGKSLRFALLPGGQDPDDLIKAGGAQAMQAVLDAAVPMVRLIWDNEIAGKVFDSPERRAALTKRLRELAGRIQDPDLRDAYQAEFRDLSFQQFRGGRDNGRGNGDFNRGGFKPGGFGGGNRGGFGARKGTPPPLPGTRGSLLASGADGADEELREAVILAVFFAHPVLLAEFDGQLLRMEPRHENHRHLLDLLLRAAHEDPAPTPEAMAELGGTALETLRLQPHVAIAPMLREGADTGFVRQCLAQDLQVLVTQRAARRELEELTAELESLPDDTLTYRLGETAAAVSRARGGESDDSASDLGEDTASLKAQLQTMIDSQVWVRKKRRPGPS
ncbi:DNA primase [Pararhodobacter sp. CCB-MM2]|uniref:DNA primase n=1 Tax=Pararhodobacter sp. CCB-MM2 TaxID=1786003 RepID=UPI00082FEE21|nr:DNA primase [Pararhodobacter sp. CCB-MM2]